MVLEEMIVEIFAHFSQTLALSLKLTVFPKTWWQGTGRKHHDFVLHFVATCLLFMI